MSQTPGSSCAACARRSQTLVRLGVSLDFRTRDPTLLWEALRLSDEQLIAALGGRMREQLLAWHVSGSDRPTGEERPSGIERVCRHLDRYPSALRQDALAPHELHVAGGADRLRELLNGPVVAIVGSRRCTDYGLEVARGLGRDLAATGVCVLGELCEGIAHGAHTGALQAGGPAVAVVAGGLDRIHPRSCAPLSARLKAAGCLLSELPCGARPRVWAEIARARTVALLACLVIVVEAEPESRELALAQLARVLGRGVAAVPGRVTSPLSRATNGLLRDGAVLVRGAEDALDVLYRAGSKAAHDRMTAASPRRLGSPRGPVRDSSPSGLVRLIGEGHDTIAKLSRADARPDVVLRELAELEIKGVVSRGDGGRYVPCAATPVE